MCDHDHNHDHGPEHPKDRPMEVEDPLELHGVELDGDTDVLFTCLVEEFARIGWDTETILRTFAQSEYQGPYRLMRSIGADAARQRIEQIVSRCGIWKTSTVEQPTQPEAQLVQLNVGKLKPVECD
jgi:hypothetical protein